MKRTWAILALLAVFLAIPSTSEAALVFGVRRVRVVQVQRVVAVQQVFTPLAVFQPVQAVSFLPLVASPVVVGQYQAPAAVQRVTEKVDPVTGRVIERIIER